MNNQKIVNCELAYTKCFSDFVENQDVIRYRDKLLADMYDYNYTFVKTAMEDKTLYSCIEQEISQSLLDGNNFCNIVQTAPISDSLISMFATKPEVTTYGYYSFNIADFSKFEGDKNCSILKVDGAKMVEDALYLHLEHDGESFGREFCAKMVYRRSEVYLSDTGVDAYVCYDNGVAIGNCDMFLNCNVAKIEDFEVLSTHQRKGYGRAILKELIGIAIENNAQTIYVTTDEDDTAKEMYLKCGFVKRGEKTQLFFKW